MLVHGLLTNGLLWRDVAIELAKDFRVIVPDWPLGSHEPPLNQGADLTPPGLARIIADFLERLDLQNVTLVGNDTGGALSQLVAVNHPERLGRLVLTPCDAYENFLPPMFKPLQVAARVPGAVWLIANSLRPRLARRLPFAFGWLSKRPLEPQKSWTPSSPPCSATAASARRWQRFCGGSTIATRWTPLSALDSSRSPC